MYVYVENNVWKKNNSVNVEPDFTNINKYVKFLWFYKNIYSATQSVLFFKFPNNIRVKNQISLYLFIYLF